MRGVPCFDDASPGIKTRVVAGDGQTVIVMAMTIVMIGRHAETVVSCHLPFVICHLRVDMEDIMGKSRGTTNTYTNTYIYTNLVKNDAKTRLVT